VECGLSAGRPGPILKRHVVRGCGPHTRRILDTAKPKLELRDPHACRVETKNTTRYISL
jgi:hypothetical protein